MAKRTKKSSEVAQANVHWTEWNPDDFAHRITFDFVTQVDNELEQRKLSHADLAKALGVTGGRVSQMLNSPDTISLKNAVRYARAINRKVALVLYDDKDPHNRSGPVSSELFSRCWEIAGKPNDFFQLGSHTTATFNFYLTVNYITVNLSSSAKYSTVTNWGAPSIEPWGGAFLDMRTTTRTSANPLLIQGQR